MKTVTKKTERIIMAAGQFVDEDGGDMEALIAHMKRKARLAARRKMRESCEDRFRKAAYYRQ